MSTEICDYCGELANAYNDCGEAVCPTCQYKHDACQLVDAMPAYDPHTDTPNVFVSMYSGWHSHGRHADSAPLTLKQARVVVETLVQAIRDAERLQAEHGTI